MDVLLTSPQITLKSVEGETVIMNAAPYWKKMLADFLDYACTTDDIDNTPIPMYETEITKEHIVSQMGGGDVLLLSKNELTYICIVFLAFSHMSSIDFNTYREDEVARLHDDMGFIYENVYQKKDMYTPRLKVFGGNNG